MSSEYESAYQRIEGLLKWYKSHTGERNEATTRLHLIDELLFECMGWDKRSDCVVEESIEGTYSDYSLMCPRRTVIVEAKKEGIYFDIPSGFTNRDYKIRTIVKDIPPLCIAINQAAAYCQQRGTPFGIVTNGYQLVAFIGSRQDGLPPIEGRAVVFESMEAMVEDFSLFWRLLSKSGILERNLLARLVGTDTVILPNKLSQVIPIYPGVKSRNFIQTDLHILADLVFEDIIGSQELEIEFLNKCYCQSGALSQYALISKSLLSNRYESLFVNHEEHPTIVPAISKRGLNPELLAESISKRPILILGDVGVGKTIFFRHFIHVDAHDVFANAIVFYIDFGCKAAFTMDLREFVVDEIQRQLHDKFNIDIYERSFVRAVYHNALSRFERGIYGSLKETDPKEFKQKEINFLDNKIQDAEQFLQDALGHITKGRKQQVVIFLDNADQRSDDIQQQLFIIAQSMATNWPVTVFLALRPETFQRSQRLGSMSAYHLKAFTIAPPRIDEVLIKRLNFGLDIASGRLQSSILPKEVNVDFQKVASFLTIVKYSLEQSTEIVECVDNLSGGNVRLGLDFIKRLIGSGHIDTRKILDIHTLSGRYLVRLHEFLRTIIFGDTIYYDPDSSPVENVFDIASDDSREHLLSLLILEFVDRIGKQSARHGFVGLEEVYEYSQGLGFLVNQVDDHLCRLWKKKLLETAGRIKPIDKDVSATAIRITTVGAYHLHRLPRMFVYYDAIVTDTPVLLPQYRNQILDVSDIKERLIRSENFLEYLEKCGSLIDSSKTGLDWQFLINDAKDNIIDIRAYNS